MPIGTRLSTPIPRSYLYDERLNCIADPLTREAFLRAKLVCDNLGRIPANPGMLAGILFPSNAPKAAKMYQIVEAWSRAGLVFHYQVGSRWFVEVCDNGATSRLVGNMSGQSEYPAPPRELVDSWVKEFGSDWKPIGRSGANTGTDEVHTRSNKAEHVQTRIAEGGRVEGEENGRVLVGNRGGSTDTVDLEGDQLNPDQPTNCALLSSVFKPISEGKLLGTNRFQRVVLLKLSELGNTVPTRRKKWERFMSSVMDECQSRNITWPREWGDVISKLRSLIRESE
jgi:hypothetical protein